MQKKKRADAYFGLHFDFHAVASTQGIGSKTVAEKVGEYLDAVKPDYIQVDTKGHPGYSSYLTEYGSPAPGITCDHLKIIREETAKRGILLFAHHSGIWDDAAGAEHPEWNTIDIDGQPNAGNMDITSGYVDQRLIPQLKELFGKYGFDGAWVDGETWIYRENFSPAMLKDFQEKTGYSKVDREIDSPSRLAFRQYCKDLFYKYLKHYMSAVKAEYPNVEITSNWSFSCINTEKPIEEVDYLSCDIDDLCMVRTASRCFAFQNKPWDVMGWSMPAAWKSKEGGFFPTGTRHLARLCRCGASTVAMGGGFQVVNGMTAQGEIRMLNIPTMKALADFLRLRKPFNYKSVPLPNAAIIQTQRDEARHHPDEPYYQTHVFTERYFPQIKMGYSLERYMCDVVVDGGRPVDMLFEYHVLEGKLDGRKTLIVSQNYDLPDELKDALLHFTQEGGNLIVCGLEACKIFADAVPQLKMEEYQGDLVYVATLEDPLECCGLEHTLSFTGEAEELCLAYADKLDLDAPRIKAAVKVPYGSGSLVFVGWDMFSEYLRTHFYVLRDIMRSILDKVDPEPIAYLEDGPKRAEIIPAQKDGKLLVNVINTTEFYYDRLALSFDEIPAVNNLTVAIRCEKEPESVLLEPEHTVPEYSYDGKYLHVKLKQVDIHTIIVVE